MRATIDRIEGTLAVLVLRDDESVRVTLPVSLLPSGSREGDIVVIGIERDSQATAEVKGRVSDRIEKLIHRK
jgi:hypothetical protein